MSSQEIELCSALIGIYLGGEIGELVTVIGGVDFLTLPQIKKRIVKGKNGKLVSSH
jgi:hypothetical protein